MGKVEPKGKREPAGALSEAKGAEMTAIGPRGVRSGSQRPRSRPAAISNTQCASEASLQALSARTPLRGRQLRPALLGCVLLVGLAVVLTGCGESKQEKAAKTVCAARSDIQKRIATLTTLTPSVAAVGEAKEQLSGITTDLKEIAGAQQDLKPARREQVQKGTQAFRGEVESLVSGLTSNLSLSNAESKLKAALERLKHSYAQALAPIECS